MYSFATGAALLGVLGFGLYRARRKGHRPSEAKDERELAAEINAYRRRLG